LRNIVIHGIDSSLGSYFAARCLEKPEDRIYYLPHASDVVSREAVNDLVAHAARQLAEERGTQLDLPEMMARIYRVGRDIDVHELGTSAVCIDETWIFVNSRDGRSQLETLDGLISACRSIGSREFNFVELDSSVDADQSGTNGIHATEKIADHEISQLCKEQELRYRIFRTSLVVGTGSAAIKQNCTAFSRFLSILHAFKAEIEERSPQYFDFQSLRCAVPAAATLNITGADAASDVLLRIAGTQETFESSFLIANSESTSFSDLCERIGIAYNLSLLPVADFSALNAVDRIFHERLNGFGPWGMNAAKDMNSVAHATANLSPQSAPFQAEAQIRCFETLRRSQDAALASARQRAADLPRRLASKSLTRNGSQLNYYIGGKTGTAVVILNALGQGLEYWYRLLDNLIEGHRVVLWEPRGTVAPPSPFGLGDQVDDVDAILHEEGIESCHLVGWCTGPKVAVEFYLRRPSAVVSMAFLNGTLKCDGSPEELDSSYEHNLESLFRMLARKPAMAASIRKTLQSPVEEDETEILEGADSEAMSVSVLSLMNTDLKSFVLAPFKTEETTLNYARQLLDFWAHDVRPKAGEVKVPVLLMSAEYDQVAAPESSRAAADLFPDTRHVHVKGATHYCLYDRPEFVAGLLKTFFASPDSPLNRCGQGAPSNCTQETLAKSSAVAEPVAAEVENFSS
jgi:pimeloyl-ACP methyl ester carboxylesterase